MLLEFRVSNFRSIRDEQVFSLVALGKDKELRDSNAQSTDSVQVPFVLRGAAVHGANASGKSNLVRAMGFMQVFIRDSATLVQAGQLLNVQPFAFDGSARSEPSTFELTALIDGVRWQYGFSLTGDRVQEEWLLVYKSFKPQEWFSRTWNAQTGADDYVFSKAHFTGNKDVWRQNTRSNGLFLSTAMLLNNEQLRPLWDWVVERWAVIPANVPLLLDKSLELAETPEGKRTLLEFMNSADLGISDLVLETQQGTETRKRPRFTHQGPTAAAIFGMEDESQGTQRLFALAGIALYALRLGATLVVDELENSLHSLLVRRLILLFHSPETNPRGAQLVFTTHNTSVLDGELFRRDQIWFAEKGADLATSLFPLTEFPGVRASDDFEKRYLQGRYGAIPILRDFVAEPGYSPDAGK